MFAKAIPAAARCGGECEPVPARKVLMRLAAMAILAAALGARADASITRAGTLLSNTAQVSFDLGAQSLTAATNAADIRVDELVSFSVADTGVAAGEAGFSVRNTGNGCERPSLSLTTDADPADVTLAIDTDGDGEFDAGRDAIYSSGAGPMLCPGDTVSVFVLLRAGATHRDITITLAVGGHGGLAAILPGLGDGGGDAVVVAEASSRAISLSAPDALTVSLVKSQTVIGDSGATQVNAGDIIAYTLHAIAAGQGLVESAILSDPLPAGLAYVPGSLMLDGAGLTDDADGDVAEGQANLIVVRLPAASAPFDRLVTFRARVLTPQ